MTTQQIEQEKRSLTMLIPDHMKRAGWFVKIVRDRCVFTNDHRRITYTLTGDTIPELQEHLQKFLSLYGVHINVGHQQGSKKHWQGKAA